MARNREQILYIAGAVLLLAVLYFGFDTVPSKQKELEKSRVLSGKEFDIHTLQEDARKMLEPDELTQLESLESQVQFANVDSLKVPALKMLSGFWFQHQKPILAGSYAKQVAEITQDADSWSITGTTFASALSQKDLDAGMKEDVRDQAVAAFENAISLEPSVIEHRVNQALCFIETPDVAQPMKGIQMLAGMATSYPESSLPPYHLARLAVRTGQMERAEDRIEQALKIDSTNSKIACLAIEIYKSVNKPAEAKALEGRCAGVN